MSFTCRVVGRSIETVIPRSWWQAPSGTSLGNRSPASTVIHASRSST